MDFSDGHLLVDEVPGTCLIQAGDVTPDRLIAETRTALGAPPFSATLMDESDQTAPNGGPTKHVLTFGMLSPGSDVVPVIVIAKVTNPPVPVVTAFVTLGKKGH